MRSPISAAALIPLLAGCAGHRMPEASAAAAAASATTSCYRLASGIEVVSQVGRCPSQKQVEAEVEGFLGRMGARAEAFTGAKLIFVPSWLECSGVMTWGCTRGRTMLINLAGEGTGRLARPSGSEFPEEVVWQHSYDWRATFAHEMGHLLRAEAGLASDGTHADRWWWSVAENRGRTRPAFQATDARALAIRSIAVGAGATRQLAAN